MAEETPQQLRMVGQAAALPAHGGLDLVDGVGGEVREAAVLEVAPEQFHGIEVRRVRRKPDAVTARMSLQPGSDERVLVRAPTIPDQDEGTAHVTGEMAKKPSPLGAPNVEPGRQRQGQGDAATPGRPDQRPDPGHLLMMARVDGECRRDAAGRPRPAKDGQHQKAGFIETDQVGAEAVEFFLPWPSRPESTRARDDRRAPWPAAGAAAG